MPPAADRKLEERILKAAQRLWRSRGAHGLTLRAVAREAGTTTPTVYKRFRSKLALQTALAERFKQQLNQECLSAPSIEEVYRRYLQFAEDHPHEYELLWKTWTEVFHPKGPRPGRAWFLSQMAARFGGEPEDYARVFYAFFLVAHGAADLLSVPGGDAVAHAEVRDNCLAVCDILVKNVGIFRS
jgi:AcrR family transcriptional regulator